MMGSSKILVPACGIMLLISCLCSVVVTSASQPGILSLDQNLPYFSSSADDGELLPVKSDAESTLWDSAENKISSSSSLLSSLSQLPWSREDGSVRGKRVRKLH